jgi:hypothetical protein
MSKFVKVAAPPAIDFSKIAFSMFKSFPMIQSALKTMFPGAVNWLDPIEVTNKFLKAMQDPEFQDLAIVLAQQFISHRGQKLNINEKDMFKNYDYYYKTKGTALPGMSQNLMPSIAAGAYQSTTGQLPRKEVIPTKSFSNIMDEIKAITSEIGFQTLDPAAKRKILSNKISEYTRELAPFREYLKKNFPVFSH